MHRDFGLTPKIKSEQWLFNLLLLILHTLTGGPFFNERPAHFSMSIYTISNREDNVKGVTVLDTPAVKKLYYLL